MCVLSETNIPLISESDIEVFKVFKYSRETGKILSLYMNVEQNIEPGSELTPQKIIQIEDIEVDSYGDYVIDEGFIHSSSELRICKEILLQLQTFYEFINSESNFEFITMKCIIPKEVKYYIDKYGRSYASEKLIIKERIYRWI